jgi:Eukaryotic aspartyl protease
MFNEGLIACVAFSLWLDDVESPHGQVIFGGVDTGKLVGALETIPMFAETNEYPTLSVGISKMQLSYNGVSHTLIDAEIQTFLDTGVPDIYLPQNVADLIYSLLGATFDGDSDSLHPLVPCSWKDNTTTIDFTLGSFFISVPMNELIFPADTSSSTDCPLFISRTNGANALGVSFLRNVFVVYDYSHSQVSLAKANFESTTTNITAIGPNGVGDLTSTASNNSNTTTTSAGGKPARSNSGLSTGAKAGIGVGTALGGLLLLGALVFIWRKRHQKRVTTALLDTSPAPPVSQKVSELPPQELPPEGLPPNELSSDSVPATARGA